MTMSNVNHHQVFVDMAEKAIAFDKSGQLEAAIYSYLEVARTINHLIDEGRLPSSYRDAANKYFDRSNTLKEQSKILQANIAVIANVLVMVYSDERSLRRAENTTGVEHGEG